MPAVGFHSARRLPTTDSGPSISIPAVSRERPTIPPQAAPRARTPPPPLTRPPRPLPPAPHGPQALFVRVGDAAFKLHPGRGRCGGGG